MLRHSCCEVRVIQLHDILQLRTSVILPEAISDGGLAPTTDTSLFLTTYRGGSHLPSDIFHKSKRTIFPAIRRKNGSVNPVLSGLTSIWFKQLTWIKIHVPLKYMPNFTAIIQNWMQNFMYIQLKLNFSQNIILYNFTIWNNYSRSDLPCRQSFLILFCSQIIDTFFITNSLLCLRTIKQSFTIALLSAFLLRLFHQIFYFLK